MSLITQSKKFKKEAGLLIQKSNILKTLKKYGQVKFTGAYKLDLMLSGDIDIHIINPKISKNIVVEALNKLISQGFFTGYLFYDWVKFRKPEFPKGYYIGLKKKFKAKKWKIDVWFLKRYDRAECKLMEFVQTRLNEKSRLAILKLKHAKNKKGLNISSVKIYKEVIQGCIKKT